MILKASEWKTFTDNFPRDLADPCENHWDAHKTRIQHLFELTEAPFQIDMDIELKDNTTAEAYQTQCMQEASQLCSQAAWAICYKKENQDTWFDEAQPFRDRAFVFAKQLEKFSSAYHVASAHAHYVDAALIRGGSKSPDKLDKSAVVAWTSLHHYELSRRANPEALAQIYNQIALGLRYLKTEDKVDLACAQLDKAGDLLASTDEITYDAISLAFETFLAYTEGSAHARHQMNETRTYTLAERTPPVREARELQGSLPQTALYQAYKQTSDTATLMASGCHAEAYTRLLASYHAYLGAGQGMTTNALNTLISLVESGLESNNEVTAYFATARQVHFILKYESDHDYSSRLRALEPKMECMRTAKREEVRQATPVTSGFGLTTQLAKDNTAEQAGRMHSQTEQNNHI